MIRYSPALLSVLMATSAIAAGHDHRDQVAQAVFLARAAPKVCSDFTADENAIAAYMAKEKMSEREFMNDHASATVEIGDAFAASFKRDSAAACDQVGKQLGEPGLGLITTDDD